MPYVGNPLANAFSGRLKQDLTGGSGTSFTLSHAVSSPNDLSIYINHIRQEPTTAYTVNGTALTMTGTVANTDDFYIIYDELAVQSISHPADQALTATAGTFTSGLVGTTGTFSGALSGTTGTFNGDVTISSGTSGDVVLTIESDTDNNDENDNPEIVFKQDGGLPEGGIRLGNNVTSVWNSVSLYGGISFRTGTGNSGYGDATERMKIDSAGKVGIGITTPRNNLDFGVTSNNDHIIALRDNNTSRTILGLTNGYGVRVGSPHDGTNTENMFEVGEIAGDGTTYQNTHFGVTYGGNATINNGNLVIGTNGKGIDFAAADAPTGGNPPETSTATVLDDYEEGTFTPYSNSVTGTALAAVGFYVKVGNMVTCAVRFQASGMGTNGHQFGLYLPFSAHSTQASGSYNAFTCIPAFYSAANSSGQHRVGNMDGNSNYVEFRQQNSGNNTSVTGNTMTGTFNFSFSITYRTKD